MAKDVDDGKFHRHRDSYISVESNESDICTIPENEMSGHEMNEDILFERLEFRSTNSENSVAGSPDGMSKYLAQIEKTVKNNQDEILILRSALAEALRRINSLKEEVSLR